MKQVTTATLFGLRLVRVNSYWTQKFSETEQVSTKYLLSDMFLSLPYEHVLDCKFQTEVFNEKASYNWRKSLSYFTMIKVK